MRLIYLIYLSTFSLHLIGQDIGFKESKFKLSNNFLDTTILNLSFIPEYTHGAIYIEVRFQSNCVIKDIRINRLVLKDSSDKILFKKSIFRFDETMKCLFQDLINSIEIIKTEDGLNDHNTVYTMSCMSVLMAS